MEKCYRELYGEIVKEMKDIIDSIDSNDTSYKNKIDKGNNTPMYKNMQEVLNKWLDELLELKLKRKNKKYEKKLKDKRAKKLLKAIKNKKKAKKLKELLDKLKRLKKPADEKDNHKKLKDKQKAILDYMKQLLRFIGIYGSEGGSGNLGIYKVENLQAEDMEDVNVGTAKKFINETIEKILNDLEGGKIVQMDISIRRLMEYVKKHIKNKEKKNNILRWLMEIEALKITKVIPAYKDLKVAFTPQMLKEEYHKTTIDKVAELPIKAINGYPEYEAFLNKLPAEKRISEFVAHPFINKVILLNKLSVSAEGELFKHELNAYELEVAREFTNETND